MLHLVLNSLWTGTGAYHATFFLSNENNIVENNIQYYFLILSLLYK